MSVQVVCDICGRTCVRYAVVSFKHPAPSAAPFHEMQVCLPRDGQDAGCVGFIEPGLDAARALAAEWLTEHRPESLA